MPPVVFVRPPAVNFTDNPKSYVLVGSFTNANQKMEVRLFVNDPTNPVAVLNYPQYSSAFVGFSLNKMLRPYITFTRPSLASGSVASIQVANHSVKSWIEFRIYDPALSVQPSFISDSANAQRYIKGGYGLWNNVPNFDFENKRKWFFTWQKTGKLVGESDINWLLYCHPEGTTANLEYTIYYTDGTQAINSSALTVTDNIPAERQYDQWFVPTGVTQCGLQLLAPTKQIHKYRVRILKRADNKVLAEFSYRVDYRPNYDSMAIYFRNSLGGWDSIRIIGYWEENNTYDRKDYNKEIYHDLAPFDFSSVGSIPQYQVKETRKWKANIGFIGKDEMDALRDLLLSKEVAMIKNNTWVPLVLTNDSFNGLNTKEPLQSAEITFQAAFDNDNYTPDILPWT